MRDCELPSWTMRTEAPIASRLDCVPTRRNRRLRLPASLVVSKKHRRAVVDRHQQVDVAVAVEVAARQPAPDPRAARSRGRPPTPRPETCRCPDSGTSAAACAYPTLPRMFRTVSSMCPLATTRSSRPSRSRSANRQPNPSGRAREQPMPACVATSSIVRRRLGPDTDRSSRRRSS